MKKIAEMPASGPGPNARVKNSAQNLAAIRLIVLNILRLDKSRKGGIKARRTRNEGRVRALKALRTERQNRRERTGSATFAVEGSGQSGKIVAELAHIDKYFGDQCVLKDVSTIIQRGDRVGRL